MKDYRRCLSDSLGPAAHEVLQAAHPGLCRNVEELLRLGQTPKQIADYVERVGGAELAGLAWMAACYLLAGNHPPKT